MYWNKRRQLFRHKGGVISAGPDDIVAPKSAVAALVNWCFGRRLPAMCIAVALLAFVLSGATFWVNEQLANNSSQEARSVEDVAVVVIAAKPIPYGTLVEERHLKPAVMHSDIVPDTAIKRLSDVVGTVATASIAQGEVLTANRFAKHETGSTLAALVSKNMRAITIRVDDVMGPAGFLLPGNRVNVLYLPNDSGENAVAENILQNLKVLAVDQTASTEKKGPVIVRAVTLEMTPAQAEVLIKAKRAGAITLALRNPL